MSMEKNSNKRKILLIDDSSNNIELLFDMLSNQYEIYFATDGHKGIQLAHDKMPDLILLDIIMPEVDGFEVCRQIKADPKTLNIPVIFLTAETHVDTIIKGFDVGIVDYVTKPFNASELFARVHTQIALQVQQQKLQQQNIELTKLNQQLKDEIKHRQQVEVALEQADQKLSAITEQEAKRWKVDAFVGQSPCFLNVIEQIRRLHKVDKTNVLILGESGTGKELVARAIHYGSSRVKGPFITVNCSAIPTDLADSAFFGHVKGAFTGALDNRKGYFEAADGGTLFLDELGDMPLMMQTKLLRVLEDRKVMRVGGSTEKRIDVRVIAATNSQLEERIQDKSFRQDLYYRLTGYTIHLPSLKERRDDIDILIDHFLKLLSREMNFVKGFISVDARLILQNYQFPGNIRELRNIIEHALISSNGQPIQPQHLHLIHTKVSSSNQKNILGMTNDSEFYPDTLVSELNNTNLSKDDENQFDNYLSTASNSDNSSYFSSVSSMSNQNNEEIILGYLQQHQKINNIECQRLLDISHHQASYLLKKMNKNNQIKLEGKRRWAFYKLI
jgi:two-component system, NtrC family, response regulator AtoC